MVTEMEHWEFLIQEEGYDSWRALQSPEEIELGRYRLVANSSYLDTEVEIRVIHHYQLNPNKQRSVTRKRQTTSQGLMVVVPFTTFEAGIWEISCSGVNNAQEWQEVLEIQVLEDSPTETEVLETPEVESPTSPQQSEIEDPVEAIFSEIEDWDLDTSQDSEITSQSTIEASITELEQLLQQEIDLLLIDEDEGGWKDESEQANLEFAKAFPTDASNLQVYLDDDAFMATHGETVNLSGYVESSDAETFLESATNIKLRYQLWHPQNQAVIQDLEQVILVLNFPINFNHALVVPNVKGTCLLLGEVTLEATIAEVVTQLVSHPFTITLTDLIDNLFSPPDALTKEVLSEGEEPIIPQTTQIQQTPQTEKIKGNALHLPSLKQDGLANSLGQEQRKQEQQNSSVLPPRITQGVSKVSRSLQLPQVPPPVVKPPQVEEVETFSADSPQLSPEDEGNITANSNVEGESFANLPPTEENEILALPSELEVTEAQNNLEVAIVSEVITDEDNLEVAIVSEVITDEDNLEVAAVSEVVTDEADLEVAAEESESQTSTEITESDVNKNNVAEEFQSLKLQKRFWYRLSDLATETKAWLREEAEEAKAEEIRMTASENEEETEIQLLETAETETSALQEVDLELEAELILFDNSPPEMLIIPTEEDISRETISESSREIDEESSPEATTRAFDSGEEVEAEFLHESMEESFNVSAGEEDWLEEINKINAESLEEVTEEEEIETPKSEFKVPEASDWDNLEFVVDDEEGENIELPTVPHDTSGMPYPQGVMPPQRESPLRKKTQAFVPIPVLIIPDGDLTAGDSIVVGVKVPLCEDAVFVKLWIQDRQNRTILDGPRALVDFEVNADGERETLTQVTIPYGSMEIQFDAIAINPQTQQESRKATLNKTVIPENLPDFSLKEFDV